MSEKIIGQGKCKYCGEMIRWLITKDGNFMPIQLEDNEPHFPHCGKSNFTALEWADYLEDVAHRIRKQNAIPAYSSGKCKWPYSGKTPPWEFPTMIRCID